MNTNEDKGIRQLVAVMGSYILVHMAQKGCEWAAQN